MKGGRGDWRNFEPAGHIFFLYLEVFLPSPMPKDSEAIEVLDNVRAGQRLVHTLEALLHFAEAFEEPRIGPSGVIHRRIGPRPDL